MRKIGEIHPKGVAVMTVYYDSKAGYNPYKVYLEWNELTDHGLMPRQRLVKKYADLSSCAFEMFEYSQQHNEEGR